MAALEQDEADALGRLAALELRDPRDQARFLVRHKLIRLGLLKQESNVSGLSDDGAAKSAIPQ